MPLLVSIPAIFSYKKEIFNGSGLDYDLFSYLFFIQNDNRQLRNRAVFNILDSNESGQIELVQLLNIYKSLPERSLFKHEIYL